jgi:hypothetical protein
MYAISTLKSPGLMTSVVHCLKKCEGKIPSAVPRVCNCIKNVASLTHLVLPHVVCRDLLQNGQSKRLGFGEDCRVVDNRQMRLYTHTEGEERERERNMVVSY